MIKLHVPAGMELTLNIGHPAVTATRHIFVTDQQAPARGRSQAGNLYVPQTQLARS